LPFFTEIKWYSEVGGLQNRNSLDLQKENLKKITEALILNSK